MSYELLNGENKMLAHVHAGGQKITPDKVQDEGRQSAALVEVRGKCDLL